MTNLAKDKVRDLIEANETLSEFVEGMNEQKLNRFQDALYSVMVVGYSVALFGSTIKVDAEITGFNPVNNTHICRVEDREVQVELMSYLKMNGKNYSPDSLVGRKAMLKLLPNFFTFAEEVYIYD